MNFYVITLFPQAFDSYLNESILRRALENKKISIKFYDPKDFNLESKKENSTYADRRVDDRPYGGGPGMVIEALPVARAIEKSIKDVERKSKSKKAKYKILYLCPAWLKVSTNLVSTIYNRKYKNIIIICGRYEGIDSRIKKMYKMLEVSIGDFVITGGELGAMILIDTLSRQVEGVLGNKNSLEENREENHFFYTRPETIKFKNKSYKVPKVLLSGNHAKIEEWKKIENIKLKESISKKKI